MLLTDSLQGFSLSSPLGNRRVGSPCGVGYIRSGFLHWGVSTVRLLLSGKGTHLTPPHPLAAYLLPFSHSSSLSISPLPLFSPAGDRGRAMTEVSAQVMVIPSRGCSHWPGESIHSSPLSVSINLLSVRSGSTFLPIKSFHCPASQGSGYTGLWSRRKVCVNVSLILHLLFSTQIRQIPHCVSIPLSLFMQTQLLLIMLV